MAYTPTQGIWKKMKYLSDKGDKITIVRPLTGKYHGRENCFLNYPFKEIKIWSFSKTDIKWLFNRKHLIELEKYWGGMSNPNFLQRVEIFIKKYLLLPDGLFLFPLFALFRLLLVKKNNYDLIYARIPLPSMAIAGYLISKIKGIPLCIDYYDQWFGSAHFDNLVGYRKKLEYLIEKKILKHANIIFTSTKYHRVFLINSFHIRENKIYHINGCVDKNDFENIIVNKVKRKFTITYTGSFNNLTQPIEEVISPKPFLNSVKEAVNLGYLDIDDLELNFVGYFGENNYDLIKEYQLESVINLIDHVDHRSSINYMLSSDVLLLVLFTGNEAKRRVNYKLYEYLWTRKPILALTPEGETSEIIKSHKMGIICNPNDTCEIINALRQLYIMYKNKTLNNEFSNTHDLHWCELNTIGSKIYTQLHGLK
jgi:glycosyltransferase involved in cell wall biosynthesis